MLPRTSDAPAWLTAQPIAHRGLHDRGRGIVENAAAAMRAAIEHGFAIECDVQRTRDDEAVVFHDFTLDRLTTNTGEVSKRSVAALRALPYRTGDDRIMALPDMLALVGGRVPIICEIKSRFDRDLRLADRVAMLMRDYAGPVAIKSFDPGVTAHLRRDAPCPLGIVAEADYADPEWAGLSSEAKRGLAQMLHFGDTRPDFLSYHVGDLPHAVPHLCRVGMGLPVMTWTVRRPEQRALARLWADQIVFEGFLP